MTPSDFTHIAKCGYIAQEMNECTENFSLLSRTVLEIRLLKVRYFMRAFCDRNGELHKSPSLVVSNSKTTKAKSINFKVTKISLPYFLIL